MDEIKYIQIYERVYDNPNNEDGTAKENKLLGEFELVDGEIDEYSYAVRILVQKRLC